MLRCICDVPCQKRIEGRAVMFKRGQVVDFEECPAHFKVVGEALDKEVDLEGGVLYDNISSEELYEVEGDVDDLKAYVKKNYPEVHFTNGIDFDTLVFRYIQARESRTLLIDNTGKRKNTIVEVRAQLDALDKEKETAIPDSDVESLDDLLGD